VFFPGANSSSVVISSPGKTSSFSLFIQIHS
jgi:hypothetical protein